ncbi:hypothetical protein CCACVL1_06737 [Corchorus capsularis]|uniref:Uncharacterized protein n=1 Tax=Corchorus capsularis TaxID=210143 RepID=A0A1R3JDJ6_COCAP|nr:hypothetical protein CCACVL1_06737 [Corchorus capsularis]
MASKSFQKPHVVSVVLFDARLKLE